LLKAPAARKKNVFIGPPDIEARQEALRLFMKYRPQCKIKWFGIAQYSEGHSFAELKFIVDEAARTALSDRRPISSDDLLGVIDRHPPQPKMSEEDYLL
jgi:ATP-dependent 26S proteasome regulatory subunit